VETNFGYHLLWIYGHRKAGERISIKEARPRAAQEIDQKPIKDTAKNNLLQIRQALAGKTLSGATNVTTLSVIETDWFTRGDIPHPEAARDRYPFFQTVSKLVQGATPEIVEGFYRFYLVELIEKQEAHPKSYEEAHSDLEKAYRTRKATDLARTQAQEAATRVRAGSLEFSAMPAVYGIPGAVTHSNIRNPGGQTQQREKNQRLDREIVSQAFALTPGQVAGPVDTLQGPTLIKLNKETPEHIPDLPEVEKEVQEAYRKVVATEKARDKVWETWIALEKYEDNLKKTGESLGVVVKTTEFFEIGSPVPGLPTNSVVNYVAAGLRVVGATSSVLEDPPANQQNPQPIRAYYLIQAATIEETRLPRFEEVKDLARKDLQLERAAPIAMASAETALTQIADILKAATAPLSASRSLDLASYARERKLNLLGPLSIRLDPNIPNLPSQSAGTSVSLTAYNLPLGGVSKIIPVSEAVREGIKLVDRLYGYAILQVVDIDPAQSGAASRGQAFRALSSAMQDAIQTDWSDRGRKQAQIKANPEFVSQEAISELTKESNKS
jgi:hypothetical protein